MRTIMNFVLPLANAAAEHAVISPLLILPFGLLLLLIATMPLSPAKVKHFWEHNYPFVALGLAAFVAGFYLLKIPGGGTEIIHTAKEYFSFIVLIGSLFVVSGGIHIRIRGRSTPAANVALLGIGAVVALVAYPFLWLLSIPFRIVGVVLEGLVELVRALFFLPARLLGGRARA